MRPAQPQNQNKRAPYNLEQHNCMEPSARVLPKPEVELTLHNATSKIHVWDLLDASYPTPKTKLNSHSAI